MVVDTSALIAILAGEPDAVDHGRAIAGAVAPAMSAASYVELMIIALSRALAGRAEVEEMLKDAQIELVPVSIDHARFAVAAFDRFGKGRHPAKLNFGDCFAYALAKERGEPLLFKGEDFARTDLVPAL
jgi:ribonuclease VapC